MANDQFPMYVVRPAAPWASLRTQPGINARQLAQLTSAMRIELHEAMGDAVIETSRTARLRSRRGAIFRQIMSGRRSRGYLRPESVREIFMLRPWVAIHETGGTITPVSSKYLALPMPFALRVDGRLKRRSPAGWKQYGTFVWTSRRTGKKFLVYKDKSSGVLRFLYYLADSVQMNKRLFLRESIIRQEGRVVAAWTQAMMNIINDIDLYGIAFEGLSVE